MKHVFEDRLNVLLSELLGQRGVISRSEQLGEGRKDLIVYHQGFQIVLEGSYSKIDAESDAKKRIGQLSTDLAIAVYYAKEIPQSLTEAEIKHELRNSEFYAKIVAPKDLSGTLFEYLQTGKVVAKPAKEWTKVNLSTLCNLIRESAQFILSEKHVKAIENKVDEFINQFVQYLSAHPESTLIARNLYDLLFKLYGFSIGNPIEIKEAIFAQSGLALLLGATYYETIRYAHKKKSLRELSDKGGKPALEEATSSILDVNYEPIFKVNERIIKVLPSHDRVFQNLIYLATTIASKRSLLRRDIVGRIYHKIVGGWSLKKGLATFYTQIPASYLLLRLANPVSVLGDADESIPKIPSVCDFACGSGTLLTAAYGAARLKYGTWLMKEHSTKDPREVNKSFHQTFIKSCYAFDVLQYATQIAALNLCFHSPETPLEKLKFNIYTMPLGLREEKTKQTISLGSLEFARRVPKLGEIFKKGTKVGPSEEKEEEIKPPEPFDVVVMNPPFTRATGRGGRKGGGLFGFVAEEARREHILEDFKQFRNYVREILKEKAWNFLKGSFLEPLITERSFKAYRGVGQAGEGLLFLYLADRYTKASGKIAFVLPKNILSGVSWFLIRVFLISNYHVEYVVVSYDSEEGYNFSESTNLSECLLVARKKETHTDEEDTKFAMLLHKPKTGIEASSLANQIAKEEEGFAKVNGASAFIVDIDRDSLIKNLDNWGRFVSLPNLKILDYLKSLLSGSIKVGEKVCGIPVAKLNEIISSIGIDRHQFGDNFKIIGGSAPGAVEVLHGGKEQVREKISVALNKHALPTDRGDELFKEKASRLLVPDRIRFNTAHAVSLFSEKPTLGNIFYAIKLESNKENQLKALCLWFNTTWGILTILANRQETEGLFTSLKMSQWRMLSVLNVNELPSETLDKLATIFDLYKDKDLGRIPQQYAYFKEVNLEELTQRTGLREQLLESKRLQLDKSFLEVLGIDIEEDDSLITLISLYKEIYASFEQWIG